MRNELIKPIMNKMISFLWHSMDQHTHTHTSSRAHACTREYFRFDMFLHHFSCSCAMRACALLPLAFAIIFCCWLGLSVNVTTDVLFNTLSSSHQCSAAGQNRSSSTDTPLFHYMLRPAAFSTL